MAKKPDQRLSSEILDRLPPQDLTAERNVIGSILICPESADAIGSIVKAEDFYADANQRLYARLLAMRDAGLGIDTTTLVSALREAAELETIGGPAYLAEIIGSVPTAAYAKHYAELVSAHAKRRALIHAAADAMRDAWDVTLSPGEALARLEAQLQLIGAADAAGEPRPMSELVPEAMAEIDAIASRRHSAGVLTGLTKLDESTGGLFPGELVILAARPSVGKTSLACQIAHHVATKRLVYFASIEMGDRELTTKMICSLGGVSSMRVRTGKIEQQDLQKLMEGGNELAQAKLLVHDRPSLSVSDIRRACRRLAKHDLAMIVVDYLGLVAVPERHGKRYEQVGEIVKGLKAVARELKVPALVLCQLNRATESTGKPQRPRLHNLRESGDIEQTADMVLLLHREEPETAGQRVTRTLLDVAKNRMSETGGLWLEWNAERTRYEDAQPENHEPAFDDFGA